MHVRRARGRVRGSRVVSRRARAPSCRARIAGSLSEARSLRYALFNLDAAPRDSVDPCCAFKDADDEGGEGAGGIAPLELVQISAAAHGVAPLPGSADGDEDARHALGSCCSQCPAESPASGP